jgi:alpha-L-rhamnosidase
MIPAVAFVFLVAAVPQPQSLTIEEQTEPLGVDDRTPEFAWRYAAGDGAARDQVQTAYRILVATSPGLLRAGKADVWDSGVVRSRQTSYVSYAGPRALASREVCYWTVRTWINGKAGKWAPAQRFAMGLLDPAKDWAPAQWIWHGADPRKEDDYTILRREFDGPRSAVRARIYVSASHQYMLTMNGKRVGRGPNFAYPDHQYYRVHEVELQAGRNVIEAACHWWGAGQGRPRSSRGFILQLVLAGDSKPLLVSDTSWQASRETRWIAHAGRGRYRNGEGIPAEGVDASRGAGSFEPAVVVPQDAAFPVPVHSQETEIEEVEVAPVSLQRVNNEVWVADFGKVYAAYPVVSFPTANVGKLKPVAGYRLDDKGRAVGRAQGTDMAYEFVRSGKPGDVFDPYWYLAFRYLEIDSSGEERPVVKIITRANRSRNRAAFESSDTMLNRIWELARHSVRFGSQEQFVDTPTREQAQFTYDAYTTSMAALQLFREHNLGQQALREFAQSQVKYHMDTGKVNAVYPNGDGKRDIPDWTQSYVIWLWEWYQATGDREILRELYPVAARVARWVKGLEHPKSGLIDLGNADGYVSGIVDWPDRYGYDRSTSQRTVMSVNAWLDYRYAGDLAEWAGNTAEAAEFRSWAARVAERIEGQLWSPAQNAYIDGLNADLSASAHASQQANAMMVASGLATRPDRRAGALARVKAAGFETSVLLSQFVVRALGDAGDGAALRNYVANPQGLNWARMVQDGATFTYENWIGRKRPRSEDSESHPFGAYGAVRALQEYVLGVRVAAGDRIVVKPVPVGLEWVKGTVPLEGGDLVIEIRKDKELILRVPANVEVEVEWGSKMEKRGSGLWILTR